MKTLSSKSRMIDVAREAGVTQATVSYVINGRSQEEHITLVTQRKVKQACKKLSYRRDYLATAMVTRKTQMIGMLYPKVNKFVGELINGAQGVLREHGLRMMLCFSGSDLSVEAEELDLFEHRHVDGVIAFPVWSCDRSLHWREFLDSGRPVVFVDCLPHGVEDECVGIDNFQTGYQAAEMFHREGLRRGILLRVAEHQNNIVATSREDGFRAGLRQMKMPEPTVIDSTDRESFRKCLLGKGNDAPGIFTAFTTELVYVLKAVAGCLTNMNGNIVFASCGLTDEPYFVGNKWYMAEYPALQVGRRAGLVMVDKLNGVAPDPASLTLPFRWHLNSETEALTK